MHYQLVTHAGFEFAEALYRSRLPIKVHVKPNLPKLD